MSAAPRILPGAVKWEILPSARGVVRAAGADTDEQREALREHLCNYFSGGCRAPSGGISTLGASADWKHLKVRWVLPGGGKRGGLRLAIAVDCRKYHVVLAGAWVRRDEPADEAFAEAFDDIQR